MTRAEITPFLGGFVALFAASIIVLELREAKAEGRMVNAGLVRGAAGMIVVAAVGGLLWFIWV
jgi:hypothetical protein